MPKLLRILVPLVVLGAVMAMPTTASAQTNTTCGAGAWAVDDPSSPYWLDCPAPRENYIWKSSVIRSNTATQSDFAFTDKYVAAGNYAGFRIFDISNPANPVLMSDTPCGGSQGDITIVGDLLFRSSDGSHNVPFADLNRACETSGNENQRVTLTSFDTDGDSFQLEFMGETSIPIVRGQNDTTAGIDAVLEGGNEQQAITLTGFDTDGDSFELDLNGTPTGTFTRGTNYDAASILAEIHGPTEVQTVALTDYEEDGDSYTLTYGGEDTIPIVRGQNDTAQGIETALEGGDEVQQVSLSGFTSATDSLQVQIGGNNSATLGEGGLNFTSGNTNGRNNNVASAINGIEGFAGTVSVSGSSANGFTVTFGGASANTDAPAMTLVVNCVACTHSVREVAQGGAAIASWPADGAVSVGSLSDTGYTLTFGGEGFQGTNVDPVTVTNGVAGGATVPAGVVAETTAGGPGVFPVGTIASVTNPSDTGFTLTFGGVLSQTDVDPLAVVNGAPDVTGTVRETVKGTGPIASWIAGGLSAVSNLTDAGFNVVFSGEYAAFDVPMLSVVNGTGDVTGTVVEQLKGAPGVGFVGMYIFDISDVSNPVFLKAVPVCGGGHTHTVYNDKARNRVVVYMTRSGTTGSVAGFGVSCAGLPSNRLTAVTVPKSNPKAARIASENITYPGSGGCHDTNVFEEKQRILVACLGSGVSMLDISDPLNATTVWGPFTWPNHGTWHTGSWSWSGDYVYVNGEPGGGSSSECAFDDHPAKPTVFALDADTGTLEGTWTLPRPQETTSSTSNCTVHNLNVLPLANKNVLAHSFYTAGASIIDFTNPKAPKEVAFIDQVLTPGGGPVIPSGAGCWSAYWYNGSIFCNELSWGLHIFDVDLPFWNDTMTLPAHNAQTVTNFIRCQLSFRGGPVRAGQTRTVRATAKLFGPAPLQAAKDTKVRISGPGFNRLVRTNDNGVATATVRAARRGTLRVAVREADNLNITGNCSSSRAIARAVRR